MRKLLFFVFTFMVCFIGKAQEVINLPFPSEDRGLSIMKSLRLRQSINTYTDEDISSQDLSDVLFAAVGFNRTDKRTNPTAKNAQEIDIYVANKNGVFLYNAQNNSLEKKYDKDIRTDIALSQNFVLKAPICLIITANLDKLKAVGVNDPEGRKTLAALDCGIVSQNISLCCAGIPRLCTRPRATMDKAKIIEVLKLNANTIPLMNHPIGYRFNVTHEY